MPANFASSSHTRSLLSLIVLIANIAAPVYTHNGRTLLEAGNGAIATQSIARVRHVADAGTLQGFRAPVGLAKGGTEACLDPQPPAVLAPRSTAARVDSSSPFHHTITRPHPPLRC
jgi:hypothetical protein